MTILICGDKYLTMSLYLGYNLKRVHDRCPKPTYDEDDEGMKRMVRWLQVGWKFKRTEVLKQAHFGRAWESLCVEEITLGGMEFLSKLTDM